MRKKRMIAGAVAAVFVMAAGIGVLASQEKAGGYSYLDENGNIDFASYFAVEGATTTLQENSLDFILTGTEAKLTFNKPLASDQFGLKFAGLEGNKMTEVEVVLTDAEDETQKASLIFNKMSDVSSLAKLGNTERAFIVAGSFYKENNADFYAHYDESFRAFTDNLTYTIPIVESVDGSYFDGFPSHKATLTILLKGESGSTFRLKEINRQRMGSLYLEDTETPVITVVNPINKGVVGSTVTLPKAFAMDVLADNATVTMTVTDPEGEEVKTTDGKKLTDVDPGKEYKIKLEKHGSYRMVLTATDGVNKTRPETTLLVVVDNQGPKIELKESIPTSVKVGDTLKFPEVTYSDNSCKEDEIVSWVTVKHPSGIIVEAEGSVELTEEGQYEITFLAQDAIGNLSRISAKTYAEGE